MIPTIFFDMTGREVIGFGRIDCVENCKGLGQHFVSLEHSELTIIRHKLGAA